MLSNSQRSCVVLGGGMWVCGSSSYSERSRARTERLLSWPEAQVPGDCWVNWTSTHTHIRKHTDKYTKTQRHRDTERQRHRDTETETQRHRHTHTQRHTDTDTDTYLSRLGDSPYLASFTPRTGKTQRICSAFN